MSQKTQQKQLGIQRKSVETKAPPPPKKQNPNARRDQYIMIAIALVGLVIFYLIQRGSPISAQSITPSQYQSEFMAANVPHLLLDVRTPEEFASGHIAGAVNIPLDALESRLSEVPTDKPVVVYCRSGNRSAEAVTLLKQAGYTKVRDLGGLITWTQEGFAVE